MKPSFSPRPAGQRECRRELTRLLQHSLSRVLALEAQARHLRVRVADAPLYANLRQCIDTLLHDLRIAARELTARAAALGAKLDSRPSRLARARRKMDELLRLPAQLVDALLAECQACGTRLCALMRTAHQAHDAVCERAAYFLLRTLEKQLWLLRPHVADTAHPFLLRLA